LGFPAAAALLLALLPAAAAHDIPNDITVQVYLRPDGERLNLLVRTPLKAIRDVNFPEREARYLDIQGAAPLLKDAAVLWISDFVEIYQDGMPLPKRPRVVATRVSLESDRSFESYDAAVALLTGPPLANEVNVPANQTMLDVWFEYPIRPDSADFSVHTMLARLGVRVVTALRYVMPGGATRAFAFTGDPGVVRLDPRWYQSALRFVDIGFWHILEGTDHLLFLFCLVIPLRRFRTLIPVVTAFTVAHSVTLITSAYDLGPSALWFPPLIETLIAASIVYMALENIAGGKAIQHRWMISFGFGLVHGFGFSFALREGLQFAGSHLLTSLLSFNIGVEFGQLLALCVLVPAIQLLFRFVVAERVGTIILSALVAHTGWHWMTERWDRLKQYTFQWPEWNAGFVAGVLRWVLVFMLLAAAVAWAIAAWKRRQQRLNA
jgi:hypothetical protein